MTPDLLTVVVFACVMGALMSLVLFYLYRSYPASIQGLGAWASASVLHTAAGVLFATRGQLPDALSVIAANVLLVAGNLLFHHGLRLHFGRRARPQAAVLLVVLLLLAMSWYTLVQPDHRVRVMLMTPLLAGIALANVWLLFRQPQRSFAFWFVTASLFTVIVASVLRLFTALVYGDASGLFEGTPSQSFYVQANAMGLLSLTVGLILLASESLHRELTHLVSHDSLTGALTRRALIRDCERELQRCRRHGYVMSVLMMDLDHFKRINDRHGHLVGDEVLQDFVAQVGRALRSSDRLGRFGGEEFVVLLPETPPQQALVVAERIRSRTHLVQPGGETHCSVSIGVTTSHADAPDDMNALLWRADKALYQAKAEGRDRVVFQA
ncbi:MAG: GGDEF domain-containing protein [Hylemonella sp.]|nr:GGDEF domain-containing protein [Hylemonella sp.]MDH5709355.1 GGDEF domain-containing protein [Hylemonella sp.]